MPERVVAIIQARMGSTRLPGKVLLPIEGKPFILHVIERLRDAKTITQIVLATTVDPQNDELERVVKDAYPDVMTYRGSEDDVLDRYTQAAKESKADIVIRITADDPFKDPEIVDQVVQTLLDDSSLDYCSNILGTQTYPNGLDVEAVRFPALERAWKETTEPEDREHVTLYFRKHPELFSTKGIMLPENLHHLRWTIDEDKDYEMTKIIYAKLYPTNPKFRMRDILELLKREPEIAKINEGVKQRLVQF